jgi:pimeloyl-ACP methyl ester carboxylesterase
VQTACSGLPTNKYKDATFRSGLSEVAITRGSLASSTGCSLSYTLYRPPATHRTTAARPLVILGHGFLRSQKHMAGLAMAIAEAGIPAATIGFCNMRPWNGRHQQNGSDMIALASRLAPTVGAEATLYAGFSAGGLAALIAARRDPGSLGVVTLDLVDAEGLGRRAAAGLRKPLVGLMGEPTNCNAHGNGRAVFGASPQSALHAIAGATHCDFEAPTDRICKLLCQRAPRRGSKDQNASNDTLRRHIIVRATAAIERIAATNARHQLEPALSEARPQTIDFSRQP